MIYLLSSLFFLFQYRHKYSLANYMFGLLLLSSVSAYVVGRQHSFSPESLLYVIYIDVLTCLLFLGFSHFSKPVNINFSNVNRQSLANVEKICTVLAIGVLVIDLYILYRVYHLFIAQTINVQEFKNEGEAVEMFANFVPSYILSFSNIFNGVGYLALSLHGYYLVQGQSRKATKYLLLSLTIVVSGFISLSRFMAIQYVLVYVGLIIYLYPILRTKTKKTIIKSMFVFGTLIVVILFAISSSRFSDFYTKKSSNDALISEVDHPVLFSSLDYLSQWEENSIKILKIHEFTDVYYGLYNSFGLGGYVVKKVVGSEEYFNMVDGKIEKRMGELSMGFHGPVARGVYDFGFLGTIIFILLYSRITKKCARNNKIVNIKKLIFLPVLLPLPVLFFVGNPLCSLNLNMAIIINIIAYNYLKKK